jgi:hypothetical protein
MASSGFASISNLSTVFFRHDDSSVKEYERNKTGSTYMHVFHIDPFGQRLSGAPTRAYLETFSIRDWSRPLRRVAGWRA